MPEPFRGSINVDIRDSEPDWASVRTGQGPRWFPERRLHRARRRRIFGHELLRRPDSRPRTSTASPPPAFATAQWHTTALCSPTRSCLLTGRNHTRNSMACITEAAIGFPNGSGTIPPENGMLSEILSERGWNTYMVGKWHLCPTDEMNLGLDPAQLAQRSRVRTLVRVLRRRDQPVVPRPRLRQPLRRPAPDARRGLPPDRRHDRQGARIHQGRQGGRAGEAVLPLLRPWRLPRTAPRSQGMDREVQGTLRPGLRGACARRPWPGRRKWDWCPADTTLPPINPIGTPETPNRTRRTTVPGARLHPALGFAQRRREGPLLPDGRGVRRVLGPCRLQHRTPAGLSRSERRARQHAHRRRVGQRRQRRGWPERVGQRDEVRQRRRRRPGPEPGPDGRTRRHPDLQPLPDRLGDGVQHAVQNVEALRVQRRHLRPVHHVVACRCTGQGRDPRAVLPRRRHRAHHFGRARTSMPPRPSRATPKARSTG